MAYLLFGCAGEWLNLSEKAPDYGDFMRRIWAGEVNLADKDMKIAYGRVHWERLLENARQARFNEAVRIVSERHSSSGGSAIQHQRGDATAI
jgi:hypothetical protein